mmetsp:Transcript_7909/g.26435  ORF Transcript_7909/g.26435 Transcript_7909/m.26435 type:complete len:301 (-) Transcript_7909:1421-2323(-)
MLHGAMPTRSRRDGETANSTLRWRKARRTTTRHPAAFPSCTRARFTEVVSTARRPTGRTCPATCGASPTGSRRRLRHARWRWQEGRRYLETHARLPARRIIRQGHGATQLTTSQGGVSVSSRRGGWTGRGFTYNLEKGDDRNDMMRLVLWSSQEGENFQEDGEGHFLCVLLLLDVDDCDRNLLNLRRLRVLQPLEYLCVLGPLFLLLQRERRMPALLQLHLCPSHRRLHQAGRDLSSFMPHLHVDGDDSLGPRREDVEPASLRVSVGAVEEKEARLLSQLRQHRLVRRLLRLCQRGIRTE